MFKTLTSNSFDVLWRSALVRLPRAVPTTVLRWTDPLGPYPIIIELPSRGDYKIPVYAFIRKDISPGEAAKLPVVIDFHGGGFVLGSCLEQAPFCSKMARELSAVILSVDYRMGPVDKFPAAVEDAEDVLRAVLEPSSEAGMFLREAIGLKVRENWKSLEKAERKAARKRDRSNKRRFRSKRNKAAIKLNDSLMPPSQESFSASSTASEASYISREGSTPITVDLDPSRVAVSGFSSGGNLALNLVLSISKEHHDEDWPAVFDPEYSTPIPCLLYYPSFDARQLPSERTLPKALPAGNPFWQQTSDVLAPTYLPREKAGLPRASPGLANIDGLHSQAKILLVLCGLDSLAEQSEAWVDKIADHHRCKDLRIARYQDRRHGWTQMPDGWLDEDEKRQKDDIYEKTVLFTRALWERDEAVLKPTCENITNSGSTVAVTVKHPGDLADNV